MVILSNISEGCYFLANKDAHIPAGLISPWIVIFGFALWRQTISQVFYEYSWLMVVVFVGMASFVGERTPDYLEPPDNPRHRGILHWLIGFLAVIYIMFFVFAFPYLPWLPFTYDTLLGLLIVSFLAGYASHFILDYLIPV